MASAPPDPSTSTTTSVAAAYRALVSRRRIGLTVLALAIVGVAVLDLLAGPAAIGIADLFRTLGHSEAVDPLAALIVWEIRLPQALLALAIGFALGLAGAEMQTILNNPLASPFTLGVSSAAALGASLALVFQWGIPGIATQWLVVANAFLFAMLCAWLLDLAGRWSGASTVNVVLFGIALVFTFNALVSLIQFVASAEALQGLVFWTLGSLDRASWLAVGVVLFVCAGIAPWSLRRAWALTALRMGELRAGSLGLDVRRVRLAALFRISLLAAVAVAFAGTIGFIGLVAPHIARHLFGEDHRYFLPGSALVGAVILGLSSAASKIIFPGVVVPLGIVTSLIGIPFFVAVVFRRSSIGRV